ncbi:oxygenase MpaB family protein [Rhodococcus sp. Q]|uniref:oxygenase MpaB family protein n=1 Tax=Rhodococcus sp. Q TaxID=2502252 RepID=UPI0010F7DCB5|nr:oxygenase MpaB family protein [Rhodococcus sp. Q]
MTDSRMMATRTWPFDPTLPRRDNGFFGPDSPTWKVWTHPTALIGFQRAVTLEHFDPMLAAAVADADGIYTDPRGRLDGTLSYFLVVAVGDSRTAVETSELLMRVHARVTGIEPVSGKRYAANNPDSQLWIHVTGWHSVLKAYDMFGPGPLTPEDEDRYWADCVVAAELQTCAKSDVPASRAAVREYFAEVRPRLCTSERAQRGMHYLLRTEGGAGRWPLWASSRLIAPAAIATLPKWMRVLGDFDQPAALDRAVVPAARAAVRATRSPAAMQAVLRGTLPVTRSVLKWHFANPVAESPETVTPAEARDRLRQAG